MSEKKTISSDTRLKALALFTMAVEHHRKADEFAEAMGRLLQFEEPAFGGNGSHLSDLIYGSEGRKTVEEFDLALAREGYVVEDEKPGFV